MLTSYRKLSQVAVNAEGIRSRGIIKRFSTSNSDAKRLQGLVEDINTAIRDFVVGTIITFFVIRELTATQAQTVLVRATLVDPSMSLICFADHRQECAGGASTISDYVKH